MRFTAKNSRPLESRYEPFTDHQPRVWVSNSSVRKMKTVYYLPGNRGRIDTGLGEELLNRGFTLAGRETLGEFRKLGFSEQIRLVAQDLQTEFWSEDAHVVANSYGAYLFLHAQTLMPAFIGKILLLSPIVGETSDPETMRFFVPPRSGKLHQLAHPGKYPTPNDCQIHVGETDWQANPENVKAFAEPLGIEVTVILGAGHMLGKAYVRTVLNRWLL